MKLSPTHPTVYLGFSPIYLETSDIKDLDYTDIGEITDCGAWDSHNYDVKISYFISPFRLLGDVGSFKRASFRIRFSDGWQVFFAASADFDLLMQKKRQWPGPTTLNWSLYITSKIFDNEEKPDEILS